MDQNERFFKRRPLNELYRQNNPSDFLMEDNIDMGDFVDDEEEFEPEINLDEKKTPVRKNPSSSGMSVRAAKRIWFSPRKSGRPNKEYSDKLQEAKNVLVSAGEPLKRMIVRKNPKPNELRRPRGRPKKPLPAIAKEKRPRGRPRKTPTGVEHPKRPRGRPRKHPMNINKPQRPRGRPRKNPTETQPPEDEKKKRT